MSHAPGESRRADRRRATVFGARGFVGSALAAALSTEDWEVDALGGREVPTGPLGHVFFCAGVTSDFRTRRFDAIEAHVTLAAKILRESDFESFTYLSSTRVYKDAAVGSEHSALSINPSDATDIFNASKLAGEAICLSDPRTEVRIARLSNVYGVEDRSENFLTSVIRDVIANGRVHIGLVAEQAKDYVAVEDVVSALTRFPDRARSRIINLASGVPVANGTIAAIISECTGATVTFGSNLGPQFPVIDASRMRDELGVAPRQLADELGSLVAAFSWRTAPCAGDPS